MAVTLDDFIKEIKDKHTTGLETLQRPSISVQDPLSGNISVHGETSNRPKAYAGEVIKCPWDDFSRSFLQINEAFLAPNDFPALTVNSLNDPPVQRFIDDIYTSKYARGECVMVIYSNKHEGHWLTLNKNEQQNVVELWTKATERSMNIKNCVYALIFENDGPKNSMHHPHGQQYNFDEIPPFTRDELRRSDRFYKSNKVNLFQKIHDVETKNNVRIVTENDSFIAYVPPGSRWPYEVRVIARSPKIWLTDLDTQEKTHLAEIITTVRSAYNNLFSFDYKPTIMMTLQQAPFDNREDFYRSVYGFRVEFRVTALSPKAEKLMFSIENSTGYILYSETADATAEQLRNSLKKV